MVVGVGVMVVLVVAMSARVEAVSAGSVAAVLSVGIFRRVRRADSYRLRTYRLGRPSGSDLLRRVSSSRLIGEGVKRSRRHACFTGSEEDSQKS